MASMNVSGLRANLRDVIERVKSGEEVTLTRHGQPVAVLVHPSRLRSRREAVEEHFRQGDALAERLRRGSLDRVGQGQGLAKGRADELVRELRADRDAE